MALETVFSVIGAIACVIIAHAVYVGITAFPAPSAVISKPGEARFMFFYSTWCPWSKKARPQWDAFRKELEKYPATFGGNTVVLDEFDGDEHKDKVREFDVAGYPSFKLLMPNGRAVHDMKSIPSPDALRGFLVSSLGQEEPIELKSTRA